MGSCISVGGGNVIHDFWYLGKGGGGEGDKILKCYNTFDLFALSIIFIKQYSDSMCFSSISSLKLRIIPYLCEIDVRTPTSFWSS